MPGLRRAVLFAPVAGLVILLIWSGLRFDGLPYSPGQRFSDAVTTHFPAALHLYRSVQAGQGLPVWHETIFAGHPFAANPLNKTAYPPQWLAGIVPPLLHLNALLVAHLAVAGLGMFRWSRSEGLRLEAAVVAGAAYMLSPRLIAHTGAGHLDVVYALAWLPWLMVSIRLLVAEDNRRISTVLQAALAGGLLILADLRVSLFGLALGAVYALILLRGHITVRRMSAVAAAGVVALLMILSVVLPLLAWMPTLSRSGLTSGEAGVFAMQPAHLLGLIFAPQSGNLETLSYVGLPVLILAAIALVRQPRRLAFWAAVALIAGVYALGENGGLWTFLTRVFPPLLWFRVPSRAWLIVALVLPLLAGFGLQSLMESRSRGRNLGMLVLSVALLIGGLFILLTGASDPASGFPRGMAVGFLTGSLVCLAAMARGALLSAGRLSALVVVCVLADLVFFGHHWMVWRGQDEWMNPAQIQLAESLLAESPGRIYSPTYTLEQQTAALYDLRLFGGVDPFQIATVAEAIQRGGGVEDGGYSVVQPPLTGVEGDTIENANRSAVPQLDVLARWGVTHLVSAYPLTIDGLELRTQLDAGYLYAVRVPPAAKLDTTVPAWPADWPGLPDAEAVDANNKLTILSAAVSGVAFMVVLAAYFLALRMGR
ncbi:MAG: hypothetical protein IPK19_07910 [Chloroflexi bacterium]|nr:hypothetical protein [Chloroflexota bacterium]